MVYACLATIIIVSLAFSLRFQRAVAAQVDEFTERRERMVREQIEIRGVRDTAVLDAMRRVLRHEFVPESLRDLAYADRPLPIGYGQTISQPFIVALMTTLLELEEHDVALEVGTGSGYQAAVLAELVDRVYTIEIIEPLGRAAQERLARLGYENVQVRIDDGYFGWPEAMPFDAIIVTAAATHIPPPLIGQLKADGVMIIPVGDPFLVQNLVLIRKQPDGTIITRNILPVRFVPLLGGHDT